MGSLWQALPGQRLRLRVWDDEGVVYNDLSGDTHLLGAPALHLLAAIAASGASETALSAALRDAFDFDPEHDVAAERDTLLAELAHLHLIERTA